MKHDRLKKKLRSGSIEYDSDLLSSAQNGFPKSQMLHQSDMYLDTIQLKNLDFDFEKLCSISLSNLNVYACLICGRYLQGKSKNSHAYNHSLIEDHHVFMNLTSLSTFILPDCTEVDAPILDRIKQVINPTYTIKQIADLDSSSRLLRDIEHRPFLPGYIGINNIDKNDYFNVVIQALSHVAPLRDFFLLHPLQDCSDLMKSMSLFIRKVWNPNLIRAHLSPYELLQNTMKRSKRKFEISKQADPAHFMSWILNVLRNDLLQETSDLIVNAFGGHVQIESRSKKAIDDMSSSQGALKKYDSPFFFLSLDLPPPALFTDDVYEGTMPQIDIVDLLAKFDGIKEHNIGEETRRYRLLYTPSFLVLYFKRFTNNNYNIIRNPIIIHFDPDCLDLTPFLNTEKQSSCKTNNYELISNIIHEKIVSPSEREASSFSIQLRHTATNQWYHIKDLQIKTIGKEILSLSESYIQIWRRKT